MVGTVAGDFFRGIYLAEVRSGRVLVVDDQIELAENIAEILQGLGLETDVAAPPKPD
jgi:PleD family two-component response regulator